MIIPLFLAAAAAAKTMTFNADRVAVDNVTKAAVATGHVVAVSGPFSLRGESLKRDKDGVFYFIDPTCITTCTNAPGHTHWSATSGLVYRPADSITFNNAWLRFWEIPIFWMPYMVYPLDTDCGFSWMPGYMGRWGAYLLTKYSYHLLGDPHHQDYTWWLSGATRLDWRYRNGVAVGEDLDWNLGDFGRGNFNVYYAWDLDIDDNTYYDADHNRNWSSGIERNRYAFEFKHRWEVTERDTVRVRASHYSDSSVRDDFFRRTLFNAKAQWLAYQGNGVYWEHLENAFAIGAELSGPLNKFYGMTGRAPEVYFDVQPLPLWGLPINYETQNRIGYLTRDYSEYGSGWADNAYTHSPGIWAEYDALRFDTYHRFTAPFKVADVLSVVPRIGYHGTLWNNGGATDLTGWNRAGSLGRDGIYRSILEGGATFAGRGVAWVNNSWQHMAEPYLDVLAQEAMYSGAAGGKRPYVFDSIDASQTWEDQFAGRSRNLPYSYYGVTPGWRNAWRHYGEKGVYRTVVDLDVYAALQFNRSEHWGTDDQHLLAKLGDPNYGKRCCYVSPGARLRWMPSDDIMLAALAEYDSDYNRIARGDFTFRHRLNEKFAYNFGYSMRDYRYWDFSSSPYDPQVMSSDELNRVCYGSLRAGWQHEIVDWLAWGPFIRWDTRRNELDNIGTWIDLMTDCLGFRFIVEYENSYTRIDGYERKEGWSFGFYIYLRCFGADSMSVLTGSDREN